MSKLNVLREALSEHKPYDSRKNVVWNMLNLMEYYQELGYIGSYEEIKEMYHSYGEYKAVITRTLSGTAQRGISSFLDTMVMTETLDVNTNNVELIKKAYWDKYNISYSYTYIWYQVGKGICGKVEVEVL